MQGQIFHRKHTEQEEESQLQRLSPRAAPHGTIQETLVTQHSQQTQGSGVNGPPATGHSNVNKCHLGIVFFFILTHFLPMFPLLPGVTGVEVTWLPWQSLQLAQTLLGSNSRRELDNFFHIHDLQSKGSIKTTKENSNFKDTYVCIYYTDTHKTIQPLPYK